MRTPPNGQGHRATRPRISKGKPALTTGQAAKAAGVSPHTVAVWQDAGLVAGYRLTEGGERRVYRDSLAAHLRSLGAVQEAARLTADSALEVLLVGCFSSLANRLRGLLPAEAAVLEADRGFHVGRVTAARRLDAVVLDAGCLGRSLTLELLCCLRAVCPSVRLLVIAADDDAAGLDYTAAPGVAVLPPGCPCLDLADALHHLTPGGTTDAD